MKTNKQWMLAAVLICGASMFTACGNEDSPASGGDEPVIENLAEKVIGKWIVYEKEGEPALTNRKVLINFESATSLYFSVSYMGVWQNNNKYEYTLNGNVVSCAQKVDEHTYTDVKVKIKSIDDNKMYEDFSNTISIDGVEQIKLKSSETLIRVTEDYSDAILGLWEGHVTSEMGSEFDDGEDHRWEYKADGKFNYYHKVNGEWKVVNDVINDYFVDGPLLCTRWKEAGDNAVEIREWWEIESIKDGVMKWIALREKEDGTKYTASFQMKEVE